MSETSTRETLGFQAEVKQLLKLMIHSLYSNKEIFLRELISNASDAADELRFEALTDKALYESDPELKIRVAFDKDAGTITVSDNGIGMSRQEVIENIGTIAKSGTREFFDKLTGDEAKDAHLIGQFGVGFYSSFIVADKVTVITRRAGLTPEHGVKWESDGGGDYTIEMIDRPARGTEVTLHLREGEDELLNGFRLRSIVRKYSDHIALPILMKKEEWQQNENADKGEKTAASDEDEPVNQAGALWARPKSEITEEQYHEFYKHVAHDFEPPLAYTHNKVEGTKEYTQLLYIPSRAPFDLFEREHRRGIKLYVRRVFIMDDSEHLMPGYLRFVRGVIDSNDLPLNVSREILQESRDVEMIRAGSVKRVLSMLEDLAENQKEKFATFWKEFGRAFKEGLGEDHANRERVAKLSRFASTHKDTEEQDVSLPDYIGRMKEGQDKIYYVAAETFAAAKNSPHLEIFRKKGIEVLLLSERVDEWALSFLTEFEGKALQSVAKGGLDLGKLAEEEKKEQEKDSGDYKDLIERIKKALGEKVKDVRVTQRLTESPVCLVADEHDMGMHLERLLKAAGQKVPASKPILEVNPHHPLVERLKAETDEARFGDWSQVLFDQALLAEGGQLEDPAGFVKRLNQLVLAIEARA
ncbi:MAG TPA: molecular chaperone HtpG [Burkholderiales bacterium]|nr:molecular chaperone HtpG [Burkholderiales bacterium]